MSLFNRKDLPYWLLSAFLIAAICYAANAKAETNVYLGAWSERLFSSDNLSEQHALVAIEHG